MTTPDDSISDLLKKSMATSRRPAVIAHDTQQLECEVLSDTSRTVETDKGKYVIRDQTLRTTTRYLTVREFDPELSFHDAVKEFTNVPEDS